MSSEWLKPGVIVVKLEGNALEELMEISIGAGAISAHYVLNDVLAYQTSPGITSEASFFVTYTSPKCDKSSCVNRNLDWTQRRVA